MRPLTFINGVLLGSAGALASVLGIILFFRWTLTTDPTLNQTVVTSDLPRGELLRDLAIFSGLALLSLAAFVGELRVKRWRVLADYLLAVGLTGVVLFFFAEPAERPRDFAVLALAALLVAAIYGMFSRLGWVARWSRWLGD